MRTRVDEQQGAIDQEGVDATNQPISLFGPMCETCIAYIPHFTSAGTAPEITSGQDVFGQYVGVPTIDRSPYMIELGYERVFEPIDAHFGNDHEQYGLNISVNRAHVSRVSHSQLTERILSRRPLPLIKLFGKKAISDPDISRMFLREMTVSMRLSWKRSTMSNASARV